MARKETEKMKLTKAKLQEIIKEEISEMSIVGQDTPNETAYSAMLPEIEEVITRHLGSNYALYRVLQALAEFSARSRQ